MSEASQYRPPEFEAESSAEADQYEAALQFSWLEEMAALIEHAPNPRSGVKEWFQTDIPFDGISVADCNGQIITPHKFQAELHEQDSADQVWRFRFSDNGEDRNQKHVWGIFINGKRGYNFLLSPIQGAGHEPSIADYRESMDHLWSYGDDYRQLYDGNHTGALHQLHCIVEDLYHGYDVSGGYKPDDEEAMASYEDEVADLAMTKATIPGIAKDGQLVRQKM